MKASTSMIELAIILVFMTACIPLMLNLMLVQRRETMTYYQDKSTYEAGSELVEFDENGTPAGYKISAGIPLTYASAVFIPLIQDKYYPSRYTDASGIERWYPLSYKYDYDTSDYTARLGATPPSLTNAKTFNFNPSWKTERTAQFSTLKNHSYWGLTNGNYNQYIKTVSYAPPTELPDGAEYYHEYKYLADGSTPDINETEKHDLYLVFLKEHNTWCVVNSIAYEY